MKVSKLFTIALSVSLLAGCSAGSSAAKTSDGKSGKSSKTVYRTVDEIKKDGTLKVGVFGDKAPFGYINDKGDYDGYDVYFANRMAKDLGTKIEFTPLDPAARIDAVNTGKVDITLANFTVTDERAKQVDFALPYMKVQLGVVSPSNHVITDVQQLIDNNEELIIAKGTTAETYFEKNYPDLKLQKYDAYADAYNALLAGRGAAFSTDNTEVLAWANSNKGYTVGIEAMGDTDTIAPAVAKGNKTLLDWINNEIKDLGKENFFHKDYDATLKSAFGDDSNPDDMVVEGGVVD